MTDTREFAGVLLLTDKEYRIFCDIGKGMGPKELAKHHTIALDTVTKYYERLYNKLTIHGGFRELIRLSARYEYAGLRRVAILPAPPSYKFISSNEELRKKEQNERRNTTGSETGIQNNRVLACNGSDSYRVAIRVRNHRANRNGRIV